VLAASALHRSLFTGSNPSTWVWFGGFALVAIILSAATVQGRR
jgi:hypothetical protein